MEMMKNYEKDMKTTPKKIDKSGGPIRNKTSKLKDFS